MPKLSKAPITKAIKKFDVRFVPKYRAFNILQNNIEDVVKKTTQMWKITYGLAIIKAREQEPIEIKDDEEYDNNEDIVEGGTRIKVNDEETTKKEKQKE